jgi:hypothetical protein
MFAFGFAPGERKLAMHASAAGSGIDIEPGIFWDSEFDTSR